MKRVIALALTLLSFSAALVAPASPASAAVTTVCARQVPPGYVKINDNWNPHTCGNPSSFVLNVWTVETYTDKPVGRTMRVCAPWQPSGWRLVSSSWSPTSCGRPTSQTNNLWVIQRVA